MFPLCSEGTKTACKDVGWNGIMCYAYRASSIGHIMPRSSRLTPNEIARILRLVADGASDGDIADRLGRSRQAVSKVRFETLSADKRLSRKVHNAKIFLPATLPSSALSRRALD